MGLPAFVEDVPNYEVRKGKMFVTIGDLALAMPISVFEAGCLLGKEAIAKWRAQAGQIIEFPPR